MSNEYFKEALHNFTSDYAYGSQIRHLYDQGASLERIKEKLDYPTPLETVYEYLKKYLIDSKIIVFTESDIPASFQDSSYTVEYDSLGRKSFRLKKERGKDMNDLLTRPYLGDIATIPDILNCYAHIDLSIASKNSDRLDGKLKDYCKTMPFPDKPCFIRLNPSLLDIVNSLYKAKLWKDVIISPKEGIRYIL